MEIFYWGQGCFGWANLLPPSYFGLAMGLVLKSDLLTMVSSQTESSGPNSRRTTDAFLRDDPNQDE